MIVSELLSEIKNSVNYINNSIYLKSFDTYGCVYKWLEKTSIGASRKEIFIELNEEESELNLLDKTVINSIEVIPAT